MAKSQFLPIFKSGNLIQFSRFRPKTFHVNPILIEVQLLNCIMGSQTTPSGIFQGWCWAPPPGQTKLSNTSALRRLRWTLSEKISSCLCRLTEFTYLTSVLRDICPEQLLTWPKTWFALVYHFFCNKWWVCPLERSYKFIVWIGSYIQ